MGTCRPPVSSTTLRGWLLPDTAAQPKGHLLITASLDSPPLTTISSGLIFFSYHLPLSEMPSLDLYLLVYCPFPPPEWVIITLGSPCLLRNLAQVRQPWSKSSCNKQVDEKAKAVSGSLKFWPAFPLVLKYPNFCLTLQSMEGSGHLLLYLWHIISMSSTPDMCNLRVFLPYYPRPLNLLSTLSHSASHALIFPVYSISVHNKKGTYTYPIT